MEVAASTLKVGGVVLCGGRSRRMGKSKVWLPFGGEYLLQRTVRILAGVVQPVIVAARRDQSLPSLADDVLVVRDAIEDGGPLAGMAVGFAALAGQCDAAAVVSCDHPLLMPRFIERLIELLREHPAVVPVHENHVYSLTAVYRLETYPQLTELLDQRDLAVRHFVNRCGAYIVSAVELTDADPTLDSLRNVNDPDTYQRIRRADRMRD